MRTSLFLAGLVVLGAGGGAGWYFTQPTEITATLRLGADGPDITENVSWRVVELLGEPQGQEGISLQFVERFDPLPESSNRFAVPAGAPLEVSADINGNIPVFQALTAARGQTTEVVLDAEAGLLDLTVLANDGMTLAINLGTDTSVEAYVLPEDGQMPLLLSPGTYDVFFPDDRIDLGVTEVDIVAGDVQQMTLDARFLGEVTVALAAPVEWDDRLPRPEITLRRPGAEPAFLPTRFFPDETGESTGTGIGLGPQDLIVEFARGGVSSTNVSFTHSVTVEPETARIEIPLPGTVIDLQIAGFEDIDAERISVTAVELDYRGEALAGADVGEDGTARILYTYPDWLEADDEMGVVLRIDREVSAIASIGAPAHGELVSLTLTPGTGIEDCMGDYGIDYCPDPE